MKARIFVIILVLLVLVPLYYLHQLNLDLKRQKLHVEIDEMTTRGHMEDALVRGEKTLQFAITEFGHEDLDSLRVLDAYSDLLFFRKENTKAEESRRRHLQLLLKHFRGEHPQARASRKKLLNLLLAEGRKKEALELCRSAVKTTREQFGETHERTIALLMDLTDVEIECDEITEAAANINLVLTTLRKDPKKRFPKQELALLKKLAEIHMQKNEFQEAIEIREESLVLLGKIHGKNHIEIGKALQDLARFYYAMHEWDNCRKTVLRALPSFQKNTQLGEWIQLKKLYSDASLLMEDFVTAVDARENILLKLEAGTYSTRLERIRTVIDLALIHKMNGDYQKSLTRFQQVLPIDSETFASCDDQLLETYIGILLHLEEQNAVEEILLAAIQRKNSKRYLDLYISCYLHTSGKRNFFPDELDLSEEQRKLMKYARYLVNTDEYPRGTELLRKLLAETDEDQAWQADIEKQLGHLFLRNKQYDQAYHHLQNALILLLDGAGPIPLTTRAIFYDLQEICHIAGDTEQAEELEERLKRIQKLDHLLAHPQFTEVLTTQIHKLITEEKFDIAELLSNRLLQIYLDVEGPDKHGYKDTLVLVSKICEAKGDFVNAEVNCRKALALDENEMFKLQKRLAEHLFFLGNLKIKQENHEGAILIFQRIEQIYLSQPQENQAELQKIRETLQNLTSKATVHTLEEIVDVQNVEVREETNTVVTDPINNLVSEESAEIQLLLPSIISSVDTQETKLSLDSTTVDVVETIVKTITQQTQEVQTVE